MRMWAKVEEMDVVGMEIVGGAVDVEDADAEMAMEAAAGSRPN
jgi:hypothetical protein